MREEREQKTKEVVELKEEIYYKEVPKNIAQRPIEKGDFVKMKTGSATGYVMSVDKKTALVQIGMMRMNINIRDLEHANEPLDLKPTRSIQLDTVEATEKFINKLDIRGMRIEEALETIEDFVDRALMCNADNLRILHGKGTGVLREAVKSKLREYDAVKAIKHPEEEFGGNGVTIVQLA